MRKLISIIAVLTLLLALAAPAFADGAVSSVTYAGDGDVTVTEDPALEDEGVTMVVTEATLTEEQEDSLLDSVNELFVNATAVEVVDVNLYYLEDGTPLDPEDAAELLGADGLTVTFVRSDTTTEVVGVLVWNEETQTWDSVNFVINSDGTVTVTLSTLGAVSFAVADVETTPGGGEETPEPTPGDNNGGGTTPGGTTGGGTAGGSAGGSSTSPQTGYNITGWAIAAVVMLLCAGYCLINARKKVTE